MKVHLQIIGENKLAVNLLNKPPKFIKPLKPLDITLTTGLDGELKDDSI